MTNMIVGDEVLKIDELGRVRTPVTRREVLLEEFERSGLSGKQFAALVGVKYQTFAWWVQQRRKARGLGSGPGARPMLPSQGPEAVRLVEATLAGEDTGGAGRSQRPLRVELPGGAWLEVHDGRQAGLAAELLRLLAARSC